MELALRGRIAIYFDNNDKLHFVKDPLILIEENKIIDIGMYSKLKKEIAGHDIVGDKYQLLIPGLINCHTHLAMTLFRGLADDLPLDIWLKEHIWPLEENLNAKDVYRGCKLGVIESILAGVTTANSMYWYPSSEAEAMEEIGFRGLIAAPVITGITKLEDAIEIVNKHHNTAEEKIRVTLSLHSPYTVTMTDFERSYNYLVNFNKSCNEKSKLLLHTHLAESKNEMRESKQLNSKYGIEFPDVKTPTELLNNIGILDDNLIAAHCIHLNENDINLIGSKNVRVSLNPLSNAKLGNYMPPIPEMISKVRNVGIGTDGPASNNTLDLFDTVRFLALYYKGYLHEPTVIKAKEVFKLATIGGSRALNWEGIGTLEAESLADITTINLKQPHLTPKINDENILNHFAYSMKGKDVENVIINGKLIMEEGKISNLDIEKEIELVEEITHRLLQ